MVVDAEPLHVEQLLSRPLRQVDVDEWVLATGQPLRSSLVLPEGGGTVSRALLNEQGECICLWGAYADGHTPTIGLLWLIASKAAEARARSIHRLWRRELAILHGAFPVLLALSYHRNVLHHDWLKVLGFRDLGVFHMPPFGIPYVAYQREEVPDRVRD